VKTATVSREADCWYVSIQCEIEMPNPVPNLRPVVGIDMGIAKPMALSTGQVIQLPRTTDKERHTLATLQRKVARKTKGSRNQAKARVAVARSQARLARRRKDAAHKAMTAIAKSRGVIVVEELKVRNMMASAAGTIEQPGRNVRATAALNRSMLDVAPSQIRLMLGYKGGMVRRAGHCHKPGVYQSEMQRVRPCPCRQQGSVRQHFSAELPGMRPGGQCQLQCRQEHSSRRNFGHGLRIGPERWPETGSNRHEAAKLGPSGPRVITLVLPMGLVSGCT
jgi:hypothetical protein